MVGNLIFLSVGLVVGTMFGCCLGENSEKDKRIQDLRRQLRNGESAEEENKES